MRRHDIWQSAALPFLAAGFIVGLAYFWQSVRLYDESGYLALGRTLLSAGPLDLSNAPLYSAWYFLLGLVVPDNFTLYFASWGIVACATAILIYWALPHNDRFLAGVGAVAFSIVPYYVLWPYVNLFAAVVLLGFLIMALRDADSLVRGALYVLVGFTLLVFIRPEYVVSVYVLSVAVAAIIWATQRKPLIPGPLAEQGIRARVTDSFRGLGAQAWVLMIAVLLIGAGCLVVQTFFFSASSRSAVAFAQHYNLQLAAAGKLLDNPWTSVRANVDFKLAATPSSLVDYLRADPLLFLAHVWANVLKPAYIALVLSLGLNVLCLGWGPALNRRERWVLGLTVIGAYTPVLISGALIYPQLNYMVVAYMITFVVVARCALRSRPAVWLGRSRSARGAALAAVLLLFCGASIGVAAYKAQAAGPSVAAIVDCLRRDVAVPIEDATSPGPPMLGEGAKRTILESLGGVDVYAGSSIARMSEDDLRPFPSFGAALDRARPDYVLVEDVLSRFVLSHYRGSQPIPDPIAAGAPTKRQIDGGNIGPELLAHGYSKRCGVDEVWSLYRREQHRVEIPQATRS